MHFTARHWPRVGPEVDAVSHPLTDLFHDDRGNLQHCGRVVRSLDAAVGQVLAVLDQSAQADATVVVFTSDNGGERRSWRSDAAPSCAATSATSSRPSLLH